MGSLYFEDQQKSPDVVLLTGFTEQFDADQLVKAGKLQTAQVGSSWSNPAYENLLGTIKEIGDYGHSDIILFLLNIDSQTRDNRIKYIQTIIELTTKDRKVHDFSMPGDKFGFSFVADIKSQNLKKRVYEDGLLRKYKYKANQWLSMGRDITDTQYLVNEFAFLDFEWKKDATIEQVVKNRLGKGKRVDLDK